MTILYPSWNDLYSFRIYPPLFDSKFKKDLPDPTKTPVDYYILCEQDELEMDWWRIAIDPDYIPEARYNKLYLEK